MLCVFSYAYFDPLMVLFLITLVLLLVSSYTMVILVAGAKKPRSLNFSIIEALALQECLITVLQKKIKKIQVERDSKLFIDYILKLLLFLSDLMVSTLIFRSLLDNLNILSSAISIEKIIFLQTRLPLLVTQVGTCSFR